MTIFSSKKSSNNSKDLSSNSTNQQQQQQQTSSNISRARLSRDDENSPSIQSNSNDESNLVCDSNLPSSSSLPSNSNLPSTTISTSKRKSHYHHQTTVKQARRRRGSVGEKLHSNSPGGSSPSANLTLENNLNSNTNNNEHLTTTTPSTLSLTTVNYDEQCNSEDEYEQTTLKYDRNNLNELEMRFARALKEKKGFVIKPVQEDGACLFRAVSDQIFGDEEMHATVRQNCMDYIVKNADFFRAYITEDFDEYVKRKRLPNCHGNHIEMIALSEIYNRPIEVYEYSTEPINTVHGMYKTDNEPIRLSYHCGVHYNSIVDPWRPTAGHGLGLPDLEPGKAQNSLMNTALKESEESHIEKTMLDDKLAATDWEATQDEIMEQITRESYLQWLRDTTPSNATTLTASANQTTSDNNQASSSNNLLPLRLDERKDCEFSLPFHYECDTAATSELVDDESLMRQVLAMSQIEYVENLRKQQTSPEFNDSNALSSSTTEPSHF